MKKFFLFIFLTVSFYNHSYTQNVEINNNVYNFLNRLYVKGVIQNYSNAILPISRDKVAEYLSYLDNNSFKLNKVEKKMLDDFKREFEFDLKSTTDHKKELFEKGNFLENLVDLFSDKERYLYTYIDTNFSFFSNALFESKTLMSYGDLYDKKNSSLLRWGAKMRGTINDNIGFYFFVTNGQYLGDKNLALTDITLKNNYKIHEQKSKNFDFTEGYLSYYSKPFMIQLGREKISFGQGYNEKMIISPVNALDFLKLDFSYGIINYSFIHSWLIPKINDNVTIQFDNERTFSSKYLTSHRLGISLLNNNLELGFSEMVIYSNRPPEIAYLTPLIFFKSVEHSLQDRDNSLISFDAAARVIPKIKLYGTFIIDDIDFSKIGTKWWGNLFSYQVGSFISEPLNFENFDFNIEYLKILPYTFSHRFIENNYTNYNSYIGSNIEPNSDKLSLLIKYYLTYRANIQLGFNYLRHGRNLYDEKGFLVKNVGGDINCGHRAIDSEESIFLDGNIEKIFTSSISFYYEPFNDIFIFFEYNYNLKNEDVKIKQNTINLIFNIKY